jgi:hypothetical protein
MSNKLHASALSADTFQCRAQPICADFINSKKLPARLDRLFGQGKYQCHWQLNHYIIDGPRHLSEVSTLRVTLFQQPERHHVEVLCNKEIPSLTPFAGRGGRAEDVTRLAGSEPDKLAGAKKD